MGVTLRISDSIVQSLRLPEAEIALYAQGALSLGKAAELAEMSRILFGELIAQRGIPRHYGEEDLAQDLLYARSE